MLKTRDTFQKCLNCVLLALVLILCIPSSQLVAQELYDAPAKIDLKALEPFHSVVDTLEVMSTGRDKRALQITENSYKYEYVDGGSSETTEINFLQLLNPQSLVAIDSVNTQIRQAFLHGTLALPGIWQRVWLDSVDLIKQNDNEQGTSQQISEQDSSDSTEIEAEEEEESDDWYDPERDWFTSSVFVSSRILSFSHGIITIELNYFASGSSMYGRPSRQDLTSYLCFDINTGRQVDQHILFKTHALPQIDRLVQQQFQLANEQWHAYAQTHNYTPLEHFFLTENLLVIALPRDPWDDFAALGSELRLFESYFIGGMVVLPLDSIRDYLNTSEFPALARKPVFKAESEDGPGAAEPARHRAVTLLPPPFPFSLLSKHPSFCVRTAWNPNLYRRAISALEIEQLETVYKGKDIRTIRLLSATGETYLACSLTQSGHLDTLKMWALNPLTGETGEVHLLTKLRSGARDVSGTLVYQRLQRPENGRYYDKLLALEDIGQGWKSVQVEHEFRFEWTRGEDIGLAVLGREDFASLPTEIRLYPPDKTLAYEHDSEGDISTLKFASYEVDRLIEVMYSCNDETQVMTFEYDENGLLQSVNNQIQVLYEYW